MIRQAAILALLVATTSAADAACMKSDQPEPAEGRLTLGRFKDAADRPETAFILQLAAAVCLDAQDAEDRVDSTRTIHVYSTDDAIQSSLRRLVGRTVLVRGRSFSAHTAHHHAPIVMNLSDVRAK